MKKIFCYLTFCLLTAHAEVKMQGSVVSVMSGANLLHSDSNPIVNIDFMAVVGTTLKGLVVRSIAPNERASRAAESYFIIVGRESLPKGRDPADNAPRKASITFQVVPAKTAIQTAQTILDSFAYKAPQKLITVTAVAKSLDTETLDALQDLRNTVLSANDPDIGNFKVQDLQFLMHTE